MADTERSAPPAERRDASDWAVDGGRLRSLRSLRGFSQQQLAARSGVRQQHISNMERHQTRARFGTVARLAGALDVAAIELMVGGAALASAPSLQSRFTPDQSGRLGAGLQRCAALLDQLVEAHRELRRAFEATVGDTAGRQDHD